MFLSHASIRYSTDHDNPFEFLSEKTEREQLLTAPPMTMRHRCHTPAVSSMRGSTMPLIMKYHSSGLSDFSITFERLPSAAASSPG